LTKGFIVSRNTGRKLLKQFKGGLMNDQAALDYEFMPGAG
jgi:hypothetical protein